MTFTDDNSLAQPGAEVRSIGATGGKEPSAAIYVVLAILIISVSAVACIFMSGGALANYGQFWSSLVTALTLILLLHQNSYNQFVLRRQGLDLLAAQQQANEESKSRTIQNISNTISAIDWINGNSLTSINRILDLMLNASDLNELYESSGFKSPIEFLANSGSISDLETHIKDNPYSPARFLIDEVIETHSTFQRLKDKLKCEVGLSHLEDGDIISNLIITELRSIQSRHIKA